MMDFLPVSRADMKKRGWDELDFVYVIGDAYVDHPSFGPAIISRLLESRGYTVSESSPAGLEEGKKAFRSWESPALRFW